MKANEKYNRELYERISKNSMLISMKQAEVNILEDEIEVLNIHLLNDKALLDEIVFKNENENEN